ncbi:Syntaxin-61-like protein [Drosera capensis]
MAAQFDLWEKDPFFSVAEEVQESADRMESAFRTWIHAATDVSGGWDSGALSRDLRAALGTTKWQLEEFQRAVRSTYRNGGMDETEDRHRQFIRAMEEQVALVENSLKEKTVSDGGLLMDSWVRLDEGERDELALFLSGPSMPRDVVYDTVVDVDEKMADVRLELGYLSNMCEHSGSSLMEGKDGKSLGHRRTASASPEIGSWKIVVDEKGFVENSSNGQVELVTPRRVPSFSALIGSMGTLPILKLPINGFRKWKAADYHQKDDISLLRPPQSLKGMAASWERSKSSLDGYDDCYDKQLNSWLGAIHRLLQRSLYLVRYSRPVQVALWVFLLLLSVGSFVIHCIMALESGALCSICCASHLNQETEKLFGFHLQSGPGWTILRAGFTLFIPEALQICSFSLNGARPAGGRTSM